MARKPVDAKVADDAQQSSGCGCTQPAAACAVAVCAPAMKTQRSPGPACRTSRKRRHLTGVGWSAVPAGGDLRAPDVIADVSTHTPGRSLRSHRTPPMLTPRQVEAAQVKPVVSAQIQRTKQAKRRGNRCGETRQNRNRYRVLTPLTRERGGRSSTVNWVRDLRPPRVATSSPARRRSAVRRLAPQAPALVFYTRQVRSRAAPLSSTSSTPTP
jgi:hypothetical protein